MLGGDLGRALGRVVEIFMARRQRLDLRLAGALQEIDFQERLADRLADRERAVVAQDHRALVAEVGDDPLALVEVDGDALIIVIGDLVADQHRGLGQRHQPVAMGGHRLAVRGVQVDHRMRILARHVHRAEWMVKPAALVMNGVGSTGWPLMSTLTRLEAVTSSNIRL